MKCTHGNVPMTKDKLRERLRRLESSIPHPVKIDAAELNRIATAAHAQMSEADLTHLEAISLFMKERPGETLLDCHGLLTSDQRRAISRYAQAAADAQLVPSAKEPTEIFL